MYQALYRKYRPKTFADVVGQDHITKTLKNEVASGKIAHAYLFTGSRGTGKTTCAKVLAKAVNCPNQQGGDPCGVCDICLGIDAGTVMDVLEIDAASNNGVDHIRQLREDAVFLPGQVRYRVYIIDEVHMLSTGAFNALLKIMEEPPEHVLFILATTEAHKVPATILSRCQRFDFHRIGKEDIAAYLTKIADAEGVQLTQGGALLIGRLCDGGMRDAISLLDMCIASGQTVDAEQVAKAAGTAGSGYLLALAGAVAEKNTAEALAFVDELYRQSVDLERLAQDLTAFFRDLMILKTPGAPESMLLALPDEIAEMKPVAKAFSLGEILSILTTLQECLAQMGRTANRRTEFEMAMIRLCSLSAGTSVQDLAKRIEKLEKTLAGGGFTPGRTTGEKIAKAATAPTQRTKPAEAAPKQAAEDEAALEKAPWEEAADEKEPAKGHAPRGTGEKQTAAPTGGGGRPATATPDAFMEQDSEADTPPVPKRQEDMSADGDTRFAQWQEVLAKLAKKNPPLFAALQNSDAFVRGDLILIDTKDELFFKLIRESEYAKTSLRQALQDETGKVFRLGPYQKRPAPPTAAKPKENTLQTVLDKAKDAGILIEDKD